MQSNADDWKTRHLQNGCHIFDSDGVFVKTFPGMNCIFLEDGSFLSASFTSLRRIAVNGSILWEIPGHFHHQLNLSYDKNRALALASVIKPKTDGRYFREDLFLVISLEGKILAQTQASAFMPETVSKLEFPLHSVWISPFKEIPSFETTHFNSFFEVPPQSFSSTLKEGDFIVNSVQLGVFVLSSDLKVLRSHRVLKGSVDHSIHDVQVSSKGTFLLFNNDVAGKNWKRSALQEIDPVTDKVIWEFGSEGGMTFYTAAGGGIQRLDQRYILYSLFLNGTYILDTVTGKVIRSIHGTHRLPTHGILFSQNIRAVDLKSFFARKE